MRRGDVVIVAAAGDYGKPRPAVVVQTDAFPETHPSVVICQMTSDVVDAPDFPVTVEPNEENGLRIRSQSMADKPRHGPAGTYWAIGWAPDRRRHRASQHRTGLRH